METRMNVQDEEFKIEYLKQIDIGLPIDEQKQLLIDYLEFYEYSNELLKENLDLKQKNEKYFYACCILGITSLFLLGEIICLLML